MDPTPRSSEVNKVQKRQEVKGVKVKVKVRRSRVWCGGVGVVVVVLV